MLAKRCRTLTGIFTNSIKTHTIMRKTTLLSTFKVFLLFLIVLITGGGKAFADETLYKTLTFSAATNGKSVSAYTETWTATIDEFIWNIANFNNNNNGWDFVKCGRKNNASVASITNQTTFDKPISKVVVTIDKVTAEYVNSIKLTTHTDDASSTALETIEASTVAAGGLTFTVENPKAANVYQIVFDCASAKSNGVIQVSKVEYYTSDGGGGSVTEKTAAPTLTETCTFEEDSKEVTITNNEEGATVYYTTDESDPTTESEHFTGESKTLTLTATTTVKAMATLEGKDNSRIVTATYTKKEPAVTYENIAAFIAAAPKETAKLRLTDALVYGNKNNQNIFLYDGTAMIQLYDKTKALPEAVKYGTRVTATVEGTYTLYNGQDEMQNAAFVGEPVVTEAATPYEGQEVAAAEVTESMVGKQVTVKGVTFQADKQNNNSVIVKDGETSLTIYNTLGVALPTTFRTDVKADVSGFVLLYVSKAGAKTLQIIPESEDFVTYIEDITTAAAPTLTEAGEFTGSTEVTITNNEEGATVYYTLDESEPTTESEHFTGESKTLTLTATTTVKAMAVMEGKNQSATAAATYTKVAATAEMAFAETAIELPMGETTVPANALTTTSDGIVTYTSSDETVATVAADGAVTFVAPGFTTITATAAATDSYQEATASYTLLFLSGDGTWEHPYSPVDVIYGTQIDAATEIAVAGYYVGYPGTGATSAVDDKFGNTAMALSTTTEAVSVENTIPAQVHANLREGIATEANVGQWVVVTGKKSQYFSKPGIKNNSVTQRIAMGKMEVSGTGYATYYSAAPAIVPEGMQAGLVTATAEGVLDIDYCYEAGATIPAKTGVLLKAAEGSYPQVFVATSTETPASNLLRGTLSDEQTTAPEEGKDYYFYKLSLDNDGQNIGFYWAEDGGAAFTNKAGHAYLAIEKDGNEVKGFSINDIETGINEVSKAEAQQGGIMYDLQGRRVQKAVRGLYIQNGRKFMVK